MYEEEIDKLEKEIDALSPKLEFYEKQMREEVKALHDYQVAHYRKELGQKNSKYHTEENFPEHLMGYPDNCIDKGQYHVYPLTRTKYYLNDRKLRKLKRELKFLHNIYG